MTLALGIDTGGTYTDAVLIDHESGEVLCGAKSLTTYRDLSVGIGRAVTSAFESCDASPDAVGVVALSTTLATNAIVEERGSSVALLLIGYDPRLIRQYGFERDLVTQDIVYIQGGHNDSGDEAAPLDEESLREAILERHDRVEAFAISSYFSVRNPAHELRAAELVAELSDRPVTCGHELTTRLNSVRRATTTALNARLIPLLRDLIATVRGTLDEIGVTAPLMVVRGDGSLMRSDWALQRPIETILSGPAASVVGAWHLAGRRDVWVVDVGGTTTDIAALRDGRPRLNPRGAQVGRWRTMVEAADVHTVGLGGDSEVRVSAIGDLTIGPRRVVPLSLLASQHPDVRGELERQLALESREDLTAQFVLLQRDTPYALSESEGQLLSHLGDGPRSLDWLVQHMRYGSLIMRQVRALEARRLVLRAGFTPTDALHALGRLDVWDVETARLGAQLLAALAGQPLDVFCARVVAGVSDRVTSEMVSKVLADEASLPDWTAEPAAAALLARSLGDVSSSDLGVALTLKQPMVAIGAPVEAYLPRAAEHLRTELVIPPHAGVANAVGAVAGGVVQQVRVTIQPLDLDLFRVYLPEGVRDFGMLEDALHHAEEAVTPHVAALARSAGADQVEVTVARVDSDVPVTAGWGENVYLGTELTFTAVGRPSVAV